AAEGFEQIIDFLGGSYIYYALTVSPHIYISCIKQFLITALVKRSGDVTRLQALVDKKKIVISEAVILEILQLNDAEGVNQVGDLSTHTTCFISPALTQKVFANMRRVGKGFSRVETPLFEGMLAVGQPAEEGLDAEFPTQLQQVLNVCSALSKRVENLKNDNPAQKLVIVKLEARVKKLEKANKLKSSKLRRLRKCNHSCCKPTIPAAVPTVGAAYTRRRKGVIIRDPEEELSLKTPAETPNVKDKGNGILVETPKPLKKKDQIEMDAEYAKKL
nr:hypothetical protein [Tanacetum cinerariifolium]